MSELKRCPFCGVERSDVGFIAHTDECYLMIKYMGSYTKKELGDAWNTRPIEDALRAELARRDEIIKRLQEDAERLAKVNLYDIEIYNQCPFCFTDLEYENTVHQVDCPITLHRALMKELE